MPDGRTAYPGDLTWIRRGHGTDAEIGALANSLTFNDILGAVAPTAGQCPAGYQWVRAEPLCLELEP